jgi:hypothetical protein
MLAMKDPELQDPWAWEDEVDPMPPLAVMDEEEENERKKTRTQAKAMGKSAMSESMEDEEALLTEPMARASLFDHFVE